MNSRGTPQDILRKTGCQAPLHVHRHLMFIEMYNNTQQLSVQFIRQTVPQLCNYPACHSRLQEESWRHGYGAVWSHTRADCLWLSLLSVWCKGSLVIVLWLLFCVSVRIGRTCRWRNRGWGCWRRGCSRRYFGLQGTRQEGNGEDYIKRNFMTGTFHQIFGWYIPEEWDGRGMWHVRVWKREEVRTVLVERLKDRRSLGRGKGDWRIILKWNLKKWDGAWTGLKWLRIGIGGGLLWMWKWIFRFHKILGISWLPENRLATQEGLCPM